ncbi:WD40 repeat domain-containing protein [Streptomyces sp. NBC_01615]
MRLWDISTGKTRATLTGHTDQVSDVAFSPDGHTLATSSQDSTVRLWNADTGEPRRTMLGHTDWVYAVAFGPDGHTLATASADKTVRLWNAVLPKPAAAIQKLCHTVNRDLTPPERTAYLRGQSVGQVCPSR